MNDPTGRLQAYHLEEALRMARVLVANLEKLLERANSGQVLDKPTLLMAEAQADTARGRIDRAVPELQR